jgi:hypothetical protein
VTRDVEIELIKKELENFDLQLKRFASHLESERRGQSETGKRCDQLVNTTQTMQLLLTKLDDIVRNSTGGMVMRVDRLEQRSNDNRMRLTMWLSIASGAVGILSLILQYVKKI